MEEILTCYICTYNRAAYLEKQIDSVLKQSFKNFRLIVLDNASTDGTQELMRKYHDDRIEYIRHSTNIGGLNNIKYAFEQCTSKYLIVLHDDDYCSEELFEREIDILEANRSISIVSTNGMLVDENDNDILPIKKLSKDRMYYGDEYFNGYFGGKGSLIFPTIMYRNCFIKDNNVTIDVEAGPCADVVLLADIFRVGGEAEELKEPLMYYRHHDCQDSNVNLVPMHIKLYKYLDESERFSKQLEIVRKKNNRIWVHYSMAWVYQIYKNRITVNNALELIEAYGELLKISIRKKAIMRIIISILFSVKEKRNKV